MNRILKLVTPERIMFCVVALSLAIACPGLTAKAETSTSSSKDSSKSVDTSRNVSTSENGKTVSISENDRSGITVTVTETVDGQPRQTVTQASSPADLAKKNAPAYDLYQKHLSGKDPKASVHANVHPLGAKGVPSPASAPDGKSCKAANAKAASNTATSDGGASVKGATTASGADAKEMLRQQFREMRKKNADNPALLKVIDEALRQVDELK